MSSKARRPPANGRRFGIWGLGFVWDLGFGIWDLSFLWCLVLGVWCFSLPLCFAQKQPDRPPPLDPVQAVAEARSLVAELLAQKPAENSTNSGVLRIRDANGQEREIAVRFEIFSNGTNWFSAYEADLVGTRSTASLNTPRRLKLTVIHADNTPNRYELIELGGSAATNAAPRRLTGNEAMIPFAGSDFWLADLGLEFFHWPNQRLLRKEIRHSKSCDVLESINPQPGSGGYARVVTWITLDDPHGIVHADAYDARGELLKQFDPTELKKIRGQRQLVEMEMRNRQTGSHTWIRFNLE